MIHSQKVCVNRPFSFLNFRHFSILSSKFVNTNIIT
jgi:hypothetical protein